MVRSELGLAVYLGLPLHDVKQREEEVSKQRTRRTLIRIQSVDWQYFNPEHSQEEAGDNKKVFIVFRIISVYTCLQRVRSVL